MGPMEKLTYFLTIRMYEVADLFLHSQSIFLTDSLLTFCGLLCTEHFYTAGPFLAFEVFLRTFFDYKSESVPVLAIL